MTHESEMKTNNSLAEGNSDDGGGDEGKETINNINDDKNQSTTLNDKINEIYRKIERIEGDYYDEKGKIIENFERRVSSSSLSDVAKVEAPEMIDSADSKHDAAEIETPQILEEQAQQQASDFHPQNPPDFHHDEGENVINKGDGSDLRNDQYQAEITTNWNETESQEMIQPNYNYENYGVSENQENYSQQPYPTATPLADYAQYENEGQLQPQLDNQQYDVTGNLPSSSGDVQYNAEYSYEQPENYPNYSVDPDQQQTEYAFSHHDNTQQQQEANNYNPSYNPQLDSNYQQNNYDEALENTSNYTNESAPVAYYDYDQQQHQQQQPYEAAPQITYDDQNYSHQQPAQYQSSDTLEASQYFHENDDDKAGLIQEHSNESNYGYTANSDETSGDGGMYNANEYQVDASGKNVEVTNMYESQPALETANYESHQESNEGNEQSNEESIVTSTSESSKPLQIEADAIASGDFEERTPVQPSKRDDVKLVKQLLDSESDDTTTRSNLLKTSIKEEADESDFDFSTS